MAKKSSLLSPRQRKDATCVECSRTYSPGYPISRPKELPKTLAELEALLEESWQKGCNAEADRWPDEFKDLKTSVSMFENASGIQIQGYLRTDGIGAEFRKALDEWNSGRYASLKLAVQKFEEVSGITLSDPRSAEIDGQAVRLVRDNPQVVHMTQQRLREIADSAKRISENADQMLSGLVKTVEQLAADTQKIAGEARGSIKAVGEDLKKAQEQANG